MPKRFLPKSEFARNVATLMTGASIAQAIPIVISPILTRIYTPEDFGILALFVSLTSIFGVIVSGKYELAILIPEKDEDAINIAALCLILTTLVSLAILILTSVFSSKIAELLGSDDIAFWLFFVSPVVFMIGSYNVMRYLSIRYKDFKSIAISRTVISLVSASTKLVLGFLHIGISGLMSGTILSHIFGNLAIVRSVILKKTLFKQISGNKIKKMARKYVDFPKFTLPAGTANALSLNLNSVFITSLFSTALLGQFSLVQKIVGIPTTLIAQSVSDAYFQKATEERRRFGNAGRIFKTISKYLFIVATLMFLVLFFAGEDLFVIVFGDSWRPAGAYARIVAILFSIRMMVIPLSVTFSVFEKQKYNLYVTLVQLTLLLAVFSITKLFSMNMEAFLIFYTVGMSIFYAGIYYLAYNIASNGVAIEKNY